MKCVTDWGKACIDQRLMKQLLTIIMRGAKRSRKQICSSNGAKVKNFSILSLFNYKIFAFN